MATQFTHFSHTTHHFVLKSTQHTQLANFNCLDFRSQVSLELAIVLDARVRRRVDYILTQLYLFTLLLHHHYLLTQT